MNSEKSRILFIEDDPVLLKNVKEILEEEGYEVRTETDGEGGLKAVFEWMPDLIICDISIPLKNGYEVLQETISSEKAKHIPFIFLTAKVERADIRRGMQLGADDYIFKPFDLDDLLNSIKLRLEKTHQRIKPGQEEKKVYEINDKIMIKAGNRMHICEIKDLKYLQAKNPYVLLKFQNGRNSLQRQTLDEWETRLPNKYFIRIHRSTIINMEYITRMEKLNKTSYAVYLRGEDEPFVVSKRHSSKMKDTLI